VSREAGAGVAEDNGEPGICAKSKPLVLHTGRGRGSGLELDRRAAMLRTVPAERAVSLRFFRDRTAARAAAGLE
jgi:hypothetical protein